MDINQPTKKKKILPPRSSLHWIEYVGSTELTISPQGRVWGAADPESVASDGRARLPNQRSSSAVSVTPFRNCVREDPRVREPFVAGFKYVIYSSLSFIFIFISVRLVTVDLSESGKWNPKRRAMAEEKAADASAETASPSPPPPPPEKARDDKGDVVSVELPAPTGWKKKVRFL
ncbi:hypothetical protein B296_00041050 [Ensete ventricosum]|uniref:Uncharacterized protein n=1 Tax=Ensete ventricosum TaxID=4639 RepID=A0A426Z0W8_ENSVE|nr:hypothetical protein B296_00041050 [Ensete ventricosum]